MYVYASGEYGYITKFSVTPALYCQCLKLIFGVEILLTTKHDYRLFPHMPLLMYNFCHVNNLYCYGNDSTFCYGTSIR